MTKTLIVAMSLLLSVVIIAVAVAMLNFNFGQYVEVQRQTAKSEAIQGCLEVATVRYENADGAEVTEPVQPIFERCVTDKGFDTSWQVGEAEAGAE